MSDQKPASAPGQVQPVVRHLRDLLSQWRETVMLYETAPELREAASGYRECIAELEQILAGDLSAIERMPNSVLGSSRASRSWGRK